MFSLADAGASQIELHGIDSNHSIYFTPAANARSALRKDPFLLRVFSQPAAAAEHDQADDEWDPVCDGAANAERIGWLFDARWLRRSSAIPPELMVHNNSLTIQFIGHYVLVCEDPANTTLWARVHRSTYLDIQGDLLPLADDLKQLPLPFLDPAVVQPLSLPVVFASQPSMKSIQAAGIVTSYFGLISENRPVRFPVHIGAIPAGNAIVISDSASNLPAGLGMPILDSPTVAMRHQPQRSFREGAGHCRPGCGSDHTCSPGRGIAQRPAAGGADQYRDAQSAGATGCRRSSALGAHRPEGLACRLRDRGPVAGRRLRAAECLLPHRSRHFLQREAERHSAARLSL